MSTALHPRVANELWHDPELSHFLIGATSHMRYMTLLYNNGHYDSLAQIARENPRSLSFHHWSVILAALYKIGTVEAFELAKKNFGEQGCNSIDS